MTRLRHSQRFRMIVANAFLLVCIVLCSPLGLASISSLQVASLPQFFYPLARILFIIAFLFLPLGWLVLTVASPIATGFLLISKTHPFYRSFLPVCIAAWLISWSGWMFRPPTSQWRKSGLMRITRQAKPLIGAIEFYRLRHGRYPNQLDDLVPEFISRIPSTGAVGYPEFEYRLGSGQSAIKTYEVKVKTPLPGINWDVFFYWPDKKYPTEIYGGGVERIGDWAYVHE